MTEKKKTKKTRLKGKGKKQQHETKQINRKENIYYNQDAWMEWKESNKYNSLVNSLVFTYFSYLPLVKLTYKVY